MSDRQAAENITRDNPNLSWEQVFDKAKNNLIKKGKSDFTENDVFNEMINSSQRSRAAVNEKLGL